MVGEVFSHMEDERVNPDSSDQCEVPSFTPKYAPELFLSIYKAIRPKAGVEQ